MLKGLIKWWKKLPGNPGKIVIAVLLGLLAYDIYLDKTPYLTISQWVLKVSENQPIVPFFAGGVVIGIFVHIFWRQVRYPKPKDNEICVILTDHKKLPAIPNYTLSSAKPIKKQDTVLATYTHDPIT
jgi:hypothetical protein